MEEKRSFVAASDAMQASDRKREPKYTQKALEEKLQRLIGQRRAKMAHITAKMKEMDNMKNNEEHVDKRESETLQSFYKLHEEFILLNNNIVQMLPEDEADTDQRDWYESKAATIKQFLHETEGWIQERKRSVHNEEEVAPYDSISVIADLRRQRSKSRSSSRTESSSVVSNTSSVARMKEEAKRAALLARAESLKKKKAIQLQEAKLKAELEELEIETAIAASTAKLKVFQNHEDPQDAMNEYVKYRLEQPLASLPRSQPVLEVQAQMTADAEEKEDHPMYDVSASITKHSSHAYLCHPDHSDGAPPIRPQEPTSTGDRIYEVMHHQNLITEMLVKQQSLSLLPKRDIPVFSGDPLKYKSFLRAFDNAIDNKTQNENDKLFFLEQYTRGEPQDLVRSCEHMTPEKGYREARQLLHKQYGDNLKITMAYIEKALKWPQIKTDEVKSLNAYSLFLIGCRNTMQDVDYMEEMDNPTNMRVILSKLPYKMRERWRNVAFEMQENKGRRARFTDLVDYIDRQTKIVSDPLFGDLQEVSLSTKQKEKSSFVKIAKESTPRSSSFATSVDTEKQEFSQSNQVTKTDNGKLAQNNCLYCDKNHGLGNCEKFQKLAHKDKIEYLKFKGLCFGCLVQGHLSKDCSRRLTCQLCSRKHPSILHVPREEKTSPQNERNATSEPQTTSAVSQEMCGYTGAGSNEEVLAIVPVKLKSKKGTQIIETYAFINPGSSATFCTEKIMRTLNLRGRKTDILLRTMGQEKLVRSHIKVKSQSQSQLYCQFLHMPKTHKETEISFPPIPR
nr:uncharacterized protein LOC125990036 isoform X1 [Syngnathus scovelli]